MKRARWDTLNYLSESFILTKNEWGPWDLNPGTSGDISRVPSSFVRKTDLLQIDTKLFMFKLNLIDVGRAK